MSNIIILSDELDENLIHIVNKRSEDRVCIIGEISEIKLIRGISKEVYSLTEEEPLNSIELSSLEDSIIISDEPSSFFKYLFDSDTPNSFYYKQRGIKTNKIFDTLKDIKNRFTDDCVIKVIGEELQLSPEINNKLKELGSKEYRTTQEECMKLLVTKPEILTRELKDFLNNGSIDLTNQQIYKRIIKRYYTGTLVEIGIPLVPYKSLPENSKLTDKSDYSALLFNFDLATSTEDKQKIVSKEIKNWMLKDRLNNIYVINSESKNILSSMSIPKIYIKII